MIYNLSYLKGSSLNDTIPQEKCLVKSTSQDYVVTLFRLECGPSALLAKCDIELAFCLFLVHPDEFWLLGFKFQDSWYFDKVMPMGFSVACAAFETFSTFVEWAMKVTFVCPYIMHYLNDYLMISPLTPRHVHKC